MQLEDLLSQGWSALVAAATGLLGWAAGRRKNDAEATKLEADAAAALGAGWKTFASELRGEIKRLHEEMEQQEAECARVLTAVKDQVAALTASNDKLVSELTSVRHVNTQLQHVAYTLSKGEPLTPMQREFLSGMGPGSR